MTWHPKIAIPVFILRIFCIGFCKEFISDDKNKIVVFSKNENELGAMSWTKIRGVTYWDWFTLEKRY